MLRLVVYTDADRVAGAEVVLRAVVRGLPPDFAVTVAGPDAGVVDAIASVREGASPLVVPRVAGRADVGAMRAQRRALAALDADVVHVNLTDMAACLPTIAVVATMPRVALMVVEHHPFPPQSLFQRVAKMASRRVIDAHVAVSDVLAASVAEVVRCRAIDIDVIPNGVPEAAAVTPRTDAPATLLTACRLDPDKGVDVLLDALALVPDVRLVVAGDGPERADLEARAARLGIAGRVHFAGWCDDLSPLQDASDVFVLASRAEALPLSILEAMHRGLPVIATNVGGVREAVIDGRTGRVVPPEDPAELAAAIAELVGSAEVREAMGRAGRERARARFAETTMVDAYAARYRQAAATHRRPRR